jgi:transcriptional regulator with XRE-family HTH domain
VKQRSDDLDIEHPESEARVAALRDEMDHSMSLAELRKARELTQTQLAEALETTQPGISAIENRTDLYVSTLRSYVEALGGQLEIKAVFPTETVEISSFAELGERTIEYGVRSYDIDNGIVRVIWRNLRDRHESGDEAAAELADAFEPLANAAMLSLTAYLANELIADGVNVCGVLPGYVLTPPWRERTQAVAEAEDVDFETAKQIVLDRQGLGHARWGEAREVADVVTFLLSKQASFMNGTVFRIDGGQLPTVRY